MADRKRKRDDVPTDDVLIDVELFKPKRVKKEDLSTYITKAETCNLEGIISKLRSILSDLHYSTHQCAICNWVEYSDRRTTCSNCGNYSICVRCWNSLEGNELVCLECIEQQEEEEGEEEEKVEAEKKEEEAPIISQNQKDNKHIVTTIIKVKVLLKGGNFHESYGVATMIDQNQGDAVANSIKAARSNGLKLALKLFGNILGGKM